MSISIGRATVTLTALSVLWCVWPTAIAEQVKPAASSSANNGTVEIGPLTVPLSDFITPRRKK